MCPQRSGVMSTPNGEHVMVCRIMRLIMNGADGPHNPPLVVDWRLRKWVRLTVRGAASGLVAGSVFKTGVGR